MPEISFHVTLKDIPATKCHVLMKKPCRNRNALRSVVLGVTKESLNLISFLRAPLVASLFNSGGLCGSTDSGKQPVRAEGNHCHRYLRSTDPDQKTEKSTLGQEKNRNTEEQPGNTGI